ncbi:hypothetical protein FM076_32185 [Streptomyces albus subsp. chlorinus]|uniref:hypothetical protein n=1 Tax=Streptomyces albus TaxID=1888 RepID=UPI00157033FB|nr:hypothetical protein [Streptomyces albus]NSC25561.1 hypothetical protein [Streptomyces albus subsp. chlorinus]
MRRLGRAIIALPAAILITAGTATAAAAATGSPSGAPPSGATCVSTTGAKACFVANGDAVYVKDTKANGDSVAGTLKSRLPAKWGRECFNNRGAAGGWVKCSFDVPEYQYADLWAVNKPFVGNQAYTKVYTSPII